VALDPTHPQTIMRASSALPCGADGSVASSSVRAVGLSGRIPVKVSLEGGPIRVGDYLPLSAGVPVCATGTQLRSLLSGSVLGASTSQAAAAGAPGAGLSQGAPTTSPAAVASATSGPPIIALNGDNPATVNVGATYADLGATITQPTADKSLGITTLVDGATTTQITLDTSKPGDHTIRYTSPTPRALPAPPLAP
jgi:hypothetical protein